jgi:hypothetical protein
MYYGYMDERVGKWTRVVLENDRVEFQPTGTYSRGAVVCVLMTVGMGYLMIGPLFPPVNWLGRTALTFVVGVSAAMIWHALTIRPRSIVILDADGDFLTASRRPPMVIHSKDIERIVARENEGRSNDDGKLAQIYLSVRGCDEAVLVHQRGFYRRGLVLIRETATKLAARWQVPLIDELERKRGKALS